MVKILHITDPHLPPLPKLTVGELNAKRLVGYISWHRKRKAVHRADVLRALEADIDQQNADHIHISGDLTNIALDAEYARSAQWMKIFGDAKKVSAIPGNHDHYGRKMEAAIDKHWGGYAKGDDGETFPYIRRIGNAALIGVSSAVPTLPFMANGKVDDTQLEKLGETLKTLGEEGIKRIVSIHHPSQENACAWHRGLDNDKAFRHVITQYGAELVLHGHLHKPLKADIGGVPVRGAGSCTLYPKAHYHVIICEENGDITIQHRQFNSAANAFEKSDVETLK